MKDDQQMTQAPPAKKDAPPKKVTVELLDDNHTHRGEPCKKGDQIEVHEPQAQHLVEIERGKIV